MFDSLYFNHILQLIQSNVVPYYICGVFSSCGIYLYFSKLLLSLFCYASSEIKVLNFIIKWPHQQEPEMRESGARQTDRQTDRGRVEQPGGDHLWRATVSPLVLLTPGTAVSDVSQLRAGGRTLSPSHEKAPPRKNPQPAEKFYSQLEGAGLLPGTFCH